MRVISILLLWCLALSGFDNLDFGIPGKAEFVIDRIGFAVGYNSSDKQPRWTIYCLTREEAIASEIQRSTHFTLDPEIPTPRPSSYRGSGYDLGHQVPAADMAFSAIAMRDSFRMSNICPQVPSMNRGVWKRLEKWVRDTAIREGKIWISTGPVFSRSEKTFSKDNIPVPFAFFKVIYAPESKKMIAFLVSNSASDQPVSFFAVTVDAAETATGLDFFPSIREPEQSELESTMDISLWK